MGNPQKSYSISVQVNGSQFHGNGDSMLEALQQIPIPTKINSKAVVKVSFGDRFHEFLCSPIRLRKILFPSKSFQMIHAKQLERCLI